MNGLSLRRNIIIASAEEPIPPELPVIEQGGIKGDGTNNTSNMQYRVRTRDYIDVLPSTQYQVSSNIAYGDIFQYAEDDSYITHSYMVLLPHTITTNASCKKIRIALAYASDLTTEITPSDVTQLSIMQV